MARPADGKASKDQARTTLFAYVAGRLERRRGTGYYKDELRVNLHETVVAVTGNTRTWKPGRRDPAAAGWAGELRGGEPLFRPWLLVDESALGVYRALVQLRARDLTHFDELVVALRGTVGVCEVHACDDGESVFAVVLWRDPADKRRLTEHFRRELSVGSRPRWYTIDSSTYPAPKTWRQLTRQAAGDDDLALEPPPGPTRKRAPSSSRRPAR
jgi:hypothetical protein